MKSMKRRVYRVQWVRRSKEWTIRRAPGYVEFYATKRQAVGDARILAREDWRANKRLGQVVVYGKNGRVLFEHTYGRDPRRYPG